MINLDLWKESLEWVIPFALGCSIGLGVTTFKNKPNGWNVFILPSMISFWLLFYAFWKSNSLFHITIFCGAMLISAFGGWPVKQWIERKKPIFKKYYQDLPIICLVIFISFGNAFEKGWPSFIYMLGVGICAGMPWVLVWQYLSKRRAAHPLKDL